MYFINGEYLADYNPEVEQKELEELIEEVLSENLDDLIQDYVNGRVEILRRGGKVGKLNHGPLAVEAAKVVKADPRRYAGKAIFKAVRGKYRELYKMNLSGGNDASEILSGSTLKAVASKLAKQPGRFRPLDQIHPDVSSLSKLLQIPAFVSSTPDYARQAGQQGRLSTPTILYSTIAWATRFIA